MALPPFYSFCFIDFTIGNFSADSCSLVYRTRAFGHKISLDSVFEIFKRCPTAGLGLMKFGLSCLAARSSRDLFTGLTRISSTFLLFNILKEMTKFNP